jgi:hypothetical protein
MLILSHFSLVSLTPHFSSYLLSDDRMWAHPYYNHTRSRTDTTGWGAWRMICWARRSLGHSLTSNYSYRGSLPSYDVLYLAIFVQNFYYTTKMWNWFLYPESSYVWDLILSRMWDASMFALNSGVTFDFFILIVANHLIQNDFVKIWKSQAMLKVYYMIK